LELAAIVLFIISSVSHLRKRTHGASVN